MTIRKNLWFNTKIEALIHLAKTHNGSLSAKYALLLHLSELE